MHSYFHDRLDITSEQEKKLADIERRYRQSRQLLEETMRLANMELADAIKKHQSYSPEVQQSVDKIHKAMGGLQKTALEHLFEMQTVLTHKQNEKLNQLITDALYENAQK